ncbi:MAG: MBL fold metallo-hydrolase, partial [Limnobacter sp.]|nr:MBL fold metallo-hydrolase [Limnobacter sp.]
GELMMTRWAQRRYNRPLTIYGPTGVAKVVAGFEMAYGLDSIYRTAHHGDDIMPPELSKAEVKEFNSMKPRGLAMFDQATVQGVKVYDHEGLAVEAFTVDHSPVEPAVAYRVSYRGRVLVISGDTTQSQAVIQASEGADVLIHEALHPGLVKRLEDIARENDRPRLAKILYDIPDYHTSPVQAAEVAKAAGVKALVYSHVVPPLPLPPLASIFLEGTEEAFDGTIRLGEDGDWISLPAHSEEVRFETRYQ